MGLFGALLSLLPGFSTLVALTQFLVGVVYPTYESFKAIESVGTRDDTQWLSYWVVFSVFQFVERFLWVVLRWIPLYGLAKIALFAWLALPQFRGAAYVYSTFVRPTLFSLLEQAKTIPAIEPYIRDFNTSGPAAAAISKKIDDAVANAGAHVEETVAPLKSHAQ